MDPYLQPLLNNIRKEYIIPDPRSGEYQRLQKLLLNAMNNKSADALRAILSGLKRKQRELSGNREGERTSIILKLLDPFGFSPKSILDVGAGTGGIISALKSYYNLPLTSVYAIDRKLPQVLDVTPLTYVDNRIPLSSGSVDMIILFVVLHHIPPEERLNIVSEISRVLSPGGIIIVREHNDNGDKNFHTFIDMVHLFWYIASNETSDPLFLMSRSETQEILKNSGLEPKSYSPYQDPNPQRLYHELYIKRPADSSYRFDTDKTQQIMQTYINRFFTAPGTYESFVSLVPAKLQEVLSKKYLSYLPKNIGSIWVEIVKDVTHSVIVGSIKHSTRNGKMVIIDSDSLRKSISEQ